MGSAGQLGQCPLRALAGGLLSGRWAESTWRLDAAAAIHDAQQRSAPTPAELASEPASFSAGTTPREGQILLAEVAGEVPARYCCLKSDLAIQSLKPILVLPEVLNMESTGETVKVFISYSHDSTEHTRRVRQLSDRLRVDGVDCRIDQYETAPPEGWRQWMDQQLAWADYILMVCTDTYHRRIRGQEEPGRGLGAAYEGSILLELLYAAGMRNGRTIPVLFRGAQTEDVPIPLRQYTRYRLWEEYEDLYRHLTGQARFVPPKLGQIQQLSPEPPAWPIDHEVGEFRRLPAQEWHRAGTADAPETRFRGGSAGGRAVAATRAPLLAVNLGLIAALILALHLWLFRFTEVFVETVAVFIGGGLVAWITLFAKPLSKDLKAWLRHRLEHLVLGSSLTTLALVLLMVAGIALALSHGSVVFQIVGEETAGLLRIRRLDVDRAPILTPVVEEVVRAGVERRFVLASGLGGGRSYQVRFAKLPPCTVEVGSLKRTVLLAPDDFLRHPVLLLRPSPQLLTVATGRAEQDRPLSLEVWRGPVLLGRLDRYTGKAILVGSDQIPADELRRRHERWRGELEARGQGDLLDALLPLSTLAMGSALHGGETLHVQLRTAEGNDFGRMPVELDAHPPESPQEEVIHVPR